MIPDRAKNILKIKLCFVGFFILGMGLFLVSPISYSEDLFSRESQAVPYTRKWTLAIAPMFGSDFKTQSSSLRGAELSFGRFFELTEDVHVRPFMVVGRYSVKRADSYNGGMYFDEYSVRGWGMGGEIHYFTPIVAAPTSLFLSLKIQTEIANLTRLQNSDVAFSEQNYNNIAGHSKEMGIGFSLQPSKSYSFVALLARRDLTFSQTDSNPNVRLQSKDKSNGFSLDGSDRPDLWQGPSKTESISTLGFSVGVVFAL